MMYNVYLLQFPVNYVSWRCITYIGARRLSDGEFWANMSQIEDIYKQLGGELPSADFSLDSSEDEVRIMLMLEHRTSV